MTKCYVIRLWFVYCLLQTGCLNWSPRKNQSWVTARDHHRSHWEEAIKMLCVNGNSKSAIQNWPAHEPNIKWIRTNYFASEKIASQIHAHRRCWGKPINHYLPGRLFVTSRCTKIATDQLQWKQPKLRTSIMHDEQFHTFMNGGNEITFVSFDGDKRKQVFYFF